jgi:hypothetical protein
MRKVSEATKKLIAGKQNYKCAAGIPDYQCPLWIGNNKGCFDESGYEIDHIVEYSMSKDDSIKNLQALCRSCHMVKTKRFMIEKSKKRDDHRDDHEWSQSVKTDLLDMNCDMLRQLCLMCDMSQYGTKNKLVEKLGNNNKFVKYYFDYIDSTKKYWFMLKPKNELREYINYFEHFSKIYNDKICLLYYSEKIYKVYGISNLIETLGNVESIAQVIGLPLTQPPVINRSNPLVLSFAPVRYGSYSEKLKKAGYKVIIVYGMCVGYTDNVVADVSEIHKAKNDCLIDDVLEYCKAKDNYVCLMHDREGQCQCANEYHFKTFENVLFEEDDDE